MMIDIKQLRVSKGLTQEDVAKVIGVSRQQISYVENGRFKPSVKLAKKLADYYNIDWKQFFEEEERNENVQ